MSIENGGNGTGLVLEQGVQSQIALANPEGYNLTGLKTDPSYHLESKFYPDLETVSAAVIVLEALRGEVIEAAGEVNEGEGLTMPRIQFSGLTDLKDFQRRVFGFNDAFLRHVIEPEERLHIPVLPLIPTRPGEYPPEKEQNQVFKACEEAYIIDPKRVGVMARTFPIRGVGCEQFAIDAIYRAGLFGGSSKLMIKIANLFDYA